jgi:hypothetical protein
MHQALTLIVLLAVLCTAGPARGEPGSGAKPSLRSHGGGRSRAPQVPPGTPGTNTISAISTNVKAGPTYKQNGKVVFCGALSYSVNSPVPHRAAQLDVTVDYDASFDASDAAAARECPNGRHYGGRASVEPKVLHLGGPEGTSTVKLSVKLEDDGQTPGVNPLAGQAVSLDLNAHCGKLPRHSQVCGISQHIDISSAQPRAHKQLRRRRPACRHVCIRLKDHLTR